MNFPKENICTYMYAWTQKAWNWTHQTLNIGYLEGNSKRIRVGWKIIILFYFIWFLSIIGEGNGTPLQYSCLENPMDRGAW